MRPNLEYRAVTVINVAGVRAYNVGDDVPASAVENLGLQVGEHVAPRDADVIPHPGLNAKVGELRAYALGQGLDRDEVDEMTRAQLLDRFPASESVEPPASVNVAPAEPQLQPQRPGPQARKADWVEYATALGMDRGEAESMTAKDLAEKLPE